MNRPYLSRSLAVCLALITLVICFPAVTRAQLNSAFWDEETGYVAGEETGFDIGIDPAVPEAMANSWSGSGWAVEANVSFRSPGPPQATVHIIGSHTSGALDFFTGIAEVQISFQFRVVQTQPPPVSVSLIPYTVEAEGSADATPSGLSSFAGVTFELLSAAHGAFITAEAIAEGLDGPASDSFTLNRLEQAELEEVFTVNLSAIAQFDAAAPGALSSGEAVADIDPIIQVANLQVPGTSSSFREFFEIEFGEGYWALGDPSPVGHMTWGQVKALYQR